MSEQRYRIVHQGEYPHECRITASEAPGTIVRCKCGAYWRSRYEYWAGRKMIAWYKLGPIRRWKYRREIRGFKDDRA